MTRLTRYAVLAMATLACVSLGACERSPYRRVDVDLEQPAAAAAAPPVNTTGQVLRVSVAAMLSPRDTYTSYSRLFERVGARLGMRIELVQRRTYAEVNELLLNGHLDVALVCTGGYLELRDRDPSAVEVLAVPIRDGKPTYQSLVIVPSSSRARRLADLAGGKFAFSDELSFSGYAYAAKLLREQGQDPRQFFGGTIFTRSHDHSVSVVAQRLVDGAAVDSLVYDDLLQRDPGLAAATRVIHRSPDFGTPPIVASTRLPPATRASLRSVLLGLEHDPQAAAALQTLHIERLAVPRPGLYDSAAAILKARR